jgi:iron(III) transport system substrate-binding protein
VLVHAPNRDNAIAFLEYLVSDEAQRIFADGNNEFPVVEGVKPTGPISKFLDFRASDVNVAVYGINAAAATAVYDRAGMP